MSVERVQRALARAGFGSRRACEQLIVDARVTVNGTVATLGDRVDPDVDSITVDGVTVNLDPNVRYYALHKPRGYLTTRTDPGERPTVYDLLGSIDAWVLPVGRLDLDTSGLLLFTNDTLFADAITSPASHVQKVYRVATARAPRRRGAARTRRGRPSVRAMPGS